MANKATEEGSFPTSRCAEVDIDAVKSCKLINQNFTKRFKERELMTRSFYPHQFMSENYIDSGLLDKLHLEKELKGHSGCVNCLDWNEAGTLLASGSDDTKAIIWDPFTYKIKKTIQTTHRENIFAVKFYPKTNDSIIATGAGDNHVFVHDLSHDTKIHGFCCGDRVKRLVTTCYLPHNLWCASEDGIVREFDIRESSKTCTKTLIDLTTLCGPKIKCKALAINSTRPHMLAVGSNDPYVRLYDRRMSGPQLYSRAMNGQKRKEISNSTNFGCIGYFSPGHLYHKQREYKRRMRFLSSTDVSFSPDGSELLVNIGGEQVYLFDLYDKHHVMYTPTSSLPSVPKKSYLNGLSGCSDQQQSDDSGRSLFPASVKCVLPFVPFCFKDRGLSQQAEQLKEKANTLFGRKEFAASVFAYNSAINIAPYSSVLYGNRAAAYLKRGWDGDTYAALRDCHMALYFNPNHVKAHFRMAKCLFELDWIKEAQTCISEFKKMYPDYSKASTCGLLEKDIKSAAKSSKKQPPDDEFQLSDVEIELQSHAYDFKQRYCGHCNTMTDIKEANFFGPNGQYIVAGSDDGSFFVWERRTANLVRIMHADDSIVNCLQPHPSICLLATSGIDPDVKLWSPLSAEWDERVVKEKEDFARANQMRMNRDPLEAMLLSMGVRSRDDTGEAVSCTTT